MEFVLEGSAEGALAAALGLGQVAGLHQKVALDAVERQPVVDPAQAVVHKVPTCHGRLLAEELNVNLASRRDHQHL